MNRAETIQLISYLASNNYKEIENKKTDQKELMIRTWEDCLKDYEFSVVMKAVKELMVSSMFMPKIAEIVDLANKYKKVANDNVPKLNSGDCKKCNNKGIMFQTRKIEGLEYFYAIRCTCVEGQKYAYDGANIKDERHRSSYYVATIDETMGV